MDWIALDVLVREDERLGREAIDDADSVAVLVAAVNGMVRRAVGAVRRRRGEATRPILLGLAPLADRLTADDKAAGDEAEPICGATSWRTRS